jgi:hypothetical protein
MLQTQCFGSLDFDKKIMYNHLTINFAESPHEPGGIQTIVIPTTQGIRDKLRVCLNVEAKIQELVLVARPV